MKRLLASAFGIALAALPASAAPVSIGGFTFDDSQYAQSVTLLSGRVDNPSRIADKSLETFGLDLVGTVRVDFGYDIINGDGFDFLVFEWFVPENLRASLSLDGESIFGSLVFQPESGFGLNIYAYDLTGLGVAPGASVGRSLFLTATGADILEVAALNVASRTPPIPPDLPETAVIPLPAGLPLLLAGLGALGIVKRRSRV
jgi:hypothetical protein